MVNWLRSRLRKWLGIEDCVSYTHMVGELGAMQQRLDNYSKELDAFKSALKSKAAQAPPRPVYTDYESSQQAVLAEFEEKK